MKGDQVVRFLVWIALWLVGCAICDLGLHLQGPWLMVGGVVTYAFISRGCGKA